MEFIALDDQPFLVVEDVGFRRHMDYIEPRYFSDVCLLFLAIVYVGMYIYLMMYIIISTQVHELLATDITALSFTSYIWSSNTSSTSMLRLTAEWINTDFKRGCASLTSV